jgi:hypothetical protein
LRCSSRRAHKLPGARGPYVLDRAEVEQLKVERDAAAQAKAEREIQRRLQAARTYQTEAEIRQALTDFETWDELLNAGFPPVEASADGERFDPRDADERASSHAARRFRPSSGRPSESSTMGCRSPRALMSAASSASSSAVIIGNWSAAGAGRFHGQENASHRTATL